MTSHRPGDAREVHSISARIDHLIGAAELARQIGDWRTAGEQILSAVYLHKVLRRLERAIRLAEETRAGVNAVGGMA